jgi:hypothetical protein
MLKDRLTKLEAEMNRKNQKMSIYDQKLLQYGANIPKDQRSGSVNSENYSRFMNFNEYKYKVKPVATAQSRLPRFQQANTRNQAMSVSLDHQNFQAMNPFNATIVKVIYYYVHRALKNYNVKLKN